MSAVPPKFPKILKWLSDAWIINLNNGIPRKMILSTSGVVHQALFTKIRSNSEDRAEIPILKILYFL